MRKHLYLTMLLLAGMPMLGTIPAFAEPVAQQQSQAATTISGTVLDENSEPVIGASVMQKGVRTNAVATDANGNFKIRIPAGATLEVSYVGYKTTTVKAANGMTVTLQPSTEMLNELVAVGYGSQKRANLTGAVATVDVSRTMESRPVSDVTRALQGAIPGLSITTSNGDISSNPSMKIRGTGSLTNVDSEPLIVIDGVPVDDMSFLNPDDVAEISVLKDASSTAIYGTRAAYGVILITTKDAGTKDRVSVKYSNNFAWSGTTVQPEFASNVDQMKYALQTTYRGGNGDREIFGLYFADLLPWMEKWQEQHNGEKYTDYRELQPYVDENNIGDYAVVDGIWYRYADWDVAKTLFNSAAPSQKHNASIEGTSGKTSYRLSFGYDDKQGLMNYNPDKQTRYMANASITSQVFSFLKAGARISFSNKEYEGPNLNRNSYQYAWRWPSFFEGYGYIKDEQGNAYSTRSAIGYQLNSPMDKTVTTQTRLQGWMEATIAKHITLYGDFTYSLKNMNSDSSASPYYMWNTWGTAAPSLFTPYTQQTSYAAQSNSRNDMWTTNIYATYSNTFSEDHNLKVMAGFTAERERYNYFYAKRTGLVDYNLPNLNLTNGTTYTTSATRYSRATAGFFGRVNYDYKGIYLFEANGRYDGSSRLAESGQWAFFPSFSAGYRFSEEEYFKPLKEWWTNGKFRVSYGHVGNQGVSRNSFLSTVSQRGQSSVYWVQNGQKITQYAMPTIVPSSLTWERLETTDLGLDLGFLNNSLTVSFDWYNRNTNKMLSPAQEVPSVLGTSAPKGNNGTLRTQGWELSLGWNHTFGDVDFYANFNLSDARSKITKWTSDNDFIYTYNPSSGNYTEGQYYGDVWGFETDRYFEESDFNGQDGDGNWIYKEGVADQTYLQQGSFVYGPGDVKFKDLNGDGYINNGNSTMIEYNGAYYVEGDQGYAEASAALKEGKAEKVPVGTYRNHGDLKVIGNALPRYEYSFRLGAAWKGFDLDLFFQGVGKRDMWATGQFVVPMSQSNLGVFEHQLDCNWYTISNDEIVGYEVDQSNFYPNLYKGSMGTGKVANIGRGCFNFYPQSKYLMNMSYLRLKNVTLGYTLPKELTTKAYIQKARVYFSAENLFFLHNGMSKYKLDPEIAQTSSGAMGADDGVGTFGRTIPMMRSFSFGVQVTF